ncbi:MAG: rhomboid family intramembrane serine protease [Fimbriimonadaceae bacterium]|nr:rhomboid family intramembrane serine protease [Fimbriimonadaceae bacterium]
MTANLFAAFAVLLNPDLVNAFGFRAGQPRAMDVLTSLFLHQNVLHLLGNLVFLAAVGSAVEMATGSLRFSLVYLLSGLVGVLLHFFMSRSLPNAVPYIGASGCIAGCIGYYALRYQAVRVPVVPRVALPVLALVFGWLALQLIGAIVRVGDSGGTAYWAHIGGFGMGVLLSVVFRTPDFGQISVSRQTVAQMSVRGPAAVKIAAERHLQQFPSDPEALANLAEACRGLADPDGEARALVQRWSVAPGEADMLRLVELGRLDQLPRHSVRQSAEQLATAHPDVAREMLEFLLETATSERRPDALLELAAFEREHHPARAEELLAELNVPENALTPALDLARRRGWIHDKADGDESCPP